VLNGIVARERDLPAPLPLGYESLGRATSIGQAGAAGGRWRPPLLTAVYRTTGIRTARPNHGIGHIESKMR
jgi:hypothetical protein